MTVPAIVYAAKSTEDRHASIPDQFREAREFAEEQGWEVIGEFGDENFSAYSGNRGDGLANAERTAIEAAERTGEIVMLIAQAHDRFARGAGDKPGAPQSLGELWHRLRRRNVWLRTVEDDEELRDEASVAAIGRRAHLDSKRKSTAVKKGMRRRAQDRGKLAGGPRPYGYRWVSELVDGRAESHLEVVPAEAMVVTRIYADTVNGASQMAIAKALTRERVPTAKGRSEWTQSSVRTILINPLFAGKVRHGDDVFPGVHEPIVDMDTWEQARVLRDSAARTRGHGGGRYPRGRHLFTKGLLRCGLCGNALVPWTKPTRTPGVLYERYMCDGRRRYGTGYCPQLPIGRAVVDGAMLGELQRRFVDWDATRDQLAERLALDLQFATAAVTDADREAQLAGERLVRVQRAFQDGHLDATDYAEQATDLRESRDAARAALQQAREHLAGAETQGPSLDAEAAMFERLADLRAAVVDGARDAVGLDGLRRLLGHMFEEVKYTPVGEDDLVKRLWPEDLADFDGKAFLAPVLNMHMFPGLEEGDTRMRARRMHRPPGFQRGVLPLEAERVGLPSYSEGNAALRGLFGAIPVGS